MGKADAAAAWAEKIAADNSHGYDQGNRWGPDYDCSSLVISAYKAAGISLNSTYTGNMWQDFLAHGFVVPKNVDLATGAGLQRGDVLLNTASHTAMYIGGGKIVQAASNEFGGVTGGAPGDQTGGEIHVRSYYNFPWDCVLRYEEKTDGPAETPIPTNTEDGVYVVQSGDTLWGIAEQLLGEGARYGEIMKENALNSIIIYPGMALRIPTGGEKRTITITVKASTAAALQKLAQASGKTVGECVDGFF